MTALKGSQTELNLLTSFAGESQARNRYSFFSSQARKDGYVQIDENGEAILHNVHISQYSHATHNPNDPLRVRKLLLHKRELRKLIGKLQEKGLALIPLSIYFNQKGKAKVELGLGRGKKLYDKRATLKKKQSDREVERALRRDQ